MFFYLFYLILSPIFWAVTFLLSFFNEKIGKHFWGGFGSINRAINKIIISDTSKKVVVFHAASAGEYEQLKPILNRIDRDKIFILLTFFSPTIFEKEKSTALADAVCYHPFDFPWSALYFFLKTKTVKYVITRHDIWPTHIFIANLLGINTVLVNANLYHNSLRFSAGMKSVNRWMFHQFDLILTGSENLKNTILSLSPHANVNVTGDSRFDQIIERAEKNNISVLPSQFTSLKNVILGSIVDSDLSIIEDALKLLGDNFWNEEYKLIIVPHEVSDIDIIPIEEILSSQNLSFNRLSKFDRNLNSQVLIIDTVGHLADLYKYAQIAYVGAGFSTGVHSVIEPAVHGCLVVYGPRTDILDEAIEMSERDISIIVNNGESLATVFKKISETNEIKKWGNKAQKFVMEKKNASEKIIHEIFS